MRRRARFQSRLRGLWYLCTVGESYSLECTVTVTGSTDQPVITWLMGPMNSEVTVGVVTTDSMSTLTFNPGQPLMLGHTQVELYCMGSAMDSASRTITVQNPTITVSVASSVATPVAAGSMYSLTCTDTGAERLTDAMVTYQWLRNGVVVSGQTMATLSFSPLTFSDAGGYICRATVTSSLLSAPITGTTPLSNSLSVRLTLPRPTAIRVSSDQVNSLMVRPVGSTVTLTCMADLDPAIDVPVTVDIQLSDPAGRTLTTTTPSVSGSTYTSIATVNLFGREQSGVYTCRATVASSPPNSFLFVSSPQSGTLRVTVGVYLSLKGVVYANNSAIQITEIGETTDISANTGLQCITDRIPCCRFAIRAGEWYMYTPGRTMVPGPSAAVKFYRTRGHDDGTVNLNRPDGVTMPTGLFCCEVPDALDVMQSICANIGASVTVQIRDSGATPTPGQSYSLSCEVSGNDTTISTYRWRKGDTMLSETGLTLSFSPLSLSDAGQYTCQVTVYGTMFSSSTQDIRLTVPSPASVSITSTPASPVNEVMSAVSVICVVELGPSVMGSELSLLTVDAQLSRDGTPLTLTDSTVTGTTFTYTRQFESFGRRDSGNYTCTVNVSPQPSLTFLTGSGSQSSMAKITIGVFLTLGGQTYRSGDDILIGEVGEGDDGALLCVTDLTMCCRSDGTGGGSGLGEWRYPDGSFVPIGGSGESFYCDRGTGIVRLNRRNATMSPTGQFCCEVPDATFTNVITCINIVLELPTTSPPNPTGSEDSSSESLHERSNEAAIAVGGSIAGIIAVVTAITVVVIYWLAMRRRKSGKSDFAVSANMAYGEVKLGTLDGDYEDPDKLARSGRGGTGDFAVSANMAYGQVKVQEALGDVGGEYEDPDKLARSVRGGRSGGNYELTRRPAPYEFPVSKPDAPVYATADDTTH